MKELISIGMIPEPVRHIDSHSHDKWEIVYYFYGTGTITIGCMEILFEPGIIICLPPNTPHFENSDKGYRNYHFFVNCFNRFGTEIPKFKDTDNKDYFNILSQIYREYHLKQKNWKNIVESLLAALHNYMIAWSNLDRLSPYVEKFCNLLIVNISNPKFTIEKALSAIPLSHDYFRKLFKIEIGFTPLEYLLAKRIDYAKELLSASKVHGYKIKEIALLCGIDDQYYFSRLFKKLQVFARLNTRGQ